MSWNNFNIKPWIEKQLITNDIINPTEVQTKVIPLILQGNNVIVSSATGSGKTYAFLIPILNKIEANNKVQAVIIVPTRELAQQIFNVTKVLIKNQNIKAACFVGGSELPKEKTTNKDPEIVIGTVSRLKTLYQEHQLNITTAKMLVLDECDMLFELGFINDLDFLMEKSNNQIQCLAFSATINQELEIFLRKYFTNPKIINLNQKSSQPKIEHIFINCPISKRKEQLITLINLINPYLALIFVTNKNEITTISQLLLNDGKKTTELHSNLTARNRKQIFKRINNLDFQYIVTTDISARGIDIPGISHIISWQLPYDLHYYLHRAGRTARNNQTGISYLFYDDNDLKQLQEIKKYNINIQYYKIKNQQLVRETNLDQRIKDEPKSKLAVQTINRFKTTQKTKKVKPGYKKDFQIKMKKIDKIARKQAKKRQLKLTKQTKKH
ncbi:MAG: DEAD/DEAH box helicase [Spiroplasma sp.]|nr:DEAD/DEAH box helicase [Spiroplasma sp.]